VAALCTRSTNTPPQNPMAEPERGPPSPQNNKPGTVAGLV